MKLLCKQKKDLQPKQYIKEALYLYNTFNKEED